MGIFDKLFSSAGFNRNVQSTPRPAQRPAQAPQQNPYAMPHGENQFNYPGKYYEYFDALFRSEFPMYEIKQSAVRNPRYRQPFDPRYPFRLHSSERERNQTVFTFRRMNSIVLLVEVVHSKYNNNKLRQSCLEAGVAYLRFYFDHRGWWNEKSYVVERVHNALQTRPAVVGQPAARAQSADLYARVTPQRAQPVQTPSANSSRPEPVPTARPAAGSHASYAGASLQGERYSAAGPTPGHNASYTVTSSRVEPAAPAARRSAPQDGRDAFSQMAAGMFDRMNTPAQTPSRTQPPMAGRPAPVGRNADPTRGMPWSMTMPAEPNQYNFPGEYHQYFENLFVREFSRFQIEKEFIDRPQRMPGGGFQTVRKGVVFTFRYGLRKALVVELKSENDQSNALRVACARERVPYLRFYFDHDRWWNTYSYVTARVRDALGM